MQQPPLLEGEPGLAAERRECTAAVLVAVGGSRIGEQPALDCAHGRFNAPYLREALLDHGVFCETLETSTTWSNLASLRRAVTEAITAGLPAYGAKSLVLCDTSPIYPTGAALYFTIEAGLRGDQLAQWGGVKSQVHDTLILGGGTITHHHAISRDHPLWLEQEIGEVGMRLLRAVKTEFDPAGTLNLGVLLREGAAHA
ncbi:FAD-linked oxidase C-terminal domain-containing protein [Agrococcus sp. ARC_14]|uniref:FAD-linked oxidase C-terminal domain-containing protein n=1 Tax=Agrococcus sp. ARC_14 TaxID=2919927 RepID=UPI001F055DD7|nr:hypothetical protein [Agrococcus sp. ARC_14]